MGHAHPTLRETTFNYDAQACPACGETMVQKALVREGAADVLLWLDGNATRVLFVPAAREGPTAA